jgi:hypothetical protein
LLCSTLSFSNKLYLQNLILKGVIKKELVFYG